LVICAIILGTWNVFGLGGDIPNGKAVNEPSWPKGITNLVNTTNRVHGFFVNSEDIFFFSGTATNFTAFLLDYSRIQGVENRRLILHDGPGEAKSPWDKAGRLCDWKLYVCPKSGLEAVRTGKPSTNTDYVVEVHFWTGGKIALDQVTVPKNVEVNLLNKDR